MQGSGHKREFSSLCSRPVRRVLVLVLLAISGCVHTPAQVDIKALIARRGANEAHRDLAIRVVSDPRDVGARLALAALAEQLGRPSEAIEQLEAVQRLGGPLGTRWHAEDRARLARLLLARGRARLARGAPSALPDLERAQRLGGPPTPHELIGARIAVASTLVRHVDAKVRANGRAIFATQAANSTEPTEESAWLGARPSATPAERGAFGAWLWTIGARREAYEHLSAWHAKARVPRDETLQAAYLRAFAWWVPLWLGEVSPPPAEDLVGPERCRFPGADCPPPPAELSGLPPLVESDIPDATVAAARYASTRPIANTSSNADSARALAAIATAHARNQVVAERLGRDFVARAPDAALAHATLGSLLDALGDHKRARAEWEQAAAQSDEVAFVRGAAEAIARDGEGPAALVFATNAAAASGDPAVVWNAVGAALIASKQYVDALTAARTALDLAGPDELPRTLDIAIEASRAVGRTAQADALGLQRAQVALALRTNPADAEAFAALESHRVRPSAVTTARLWVASRKDPRDVEIRRALLESLEPDDARRTAVARELLELTGDEAPERALAAVAALRGTR